MIKSSKMSVLLVAMASLYSVAAQADGTRVDCFANFNNAGKIEQYKLRIRYDNSITDSKTDVTTLQLFESYDEIVQGNSNRGQVLFPQDVSRNQLLNASTKDILPLVSRLGDTIGLKKDMSYNMDTKKLTITQVNGSVIEVTCSATSFNAGDIVNIKVGN